MEKRYGKGKNYPFEIKIEKDTIKSLDWKTRNRKPASEAVSSKWLGLRIIWKACYSVRISLRLSKFHSALALANGAKVWVIKGRMGKKTAISKDN